MHVFRKPETIPLYESSLEEASDTETTYSTLFGSSDQYDTWNVFTRNNSELSCIDVHRDNEVESASDRVREIPPLRKKRPHTIGPLSLTSINLEKIYSTINSTQESSSSDSRRQRSHSQSSCRYVPIVKFLEFEEKAPVKRLMLNLKEKEPITGDTYLKRMQACIQKSGRFDAAVVFRGKRPPLIYDAALVKWNSREKNYINGEKIDRLWWFSLYDMKQNFVYIGNSDELTGTIVSRINQNSPRSKYVKALPLGCKKTLNLDLGDREPTTGRTYRDLMTEHFETPKESYTVAVVTEKGKHKVLDATRLGWSPDTHNKNPIKEIRWLSIGRDSNEFTCIAQTPSRSKKVKLLKFNDNTELEFDLEQKEPITGSTYRQLMLAQSRLTLAVVIDEGVPYIFNAPQLGKWNPDTITRNPITNNRIENIWWFASDSENHEFAFIGSTKDSSREIGSRINQQSPRRRNSKGSFIQKIGSQIKMPLG